MRTAAISLVVVLAVLACILAAYSAGAPGVGSTLYFDIDVMPLLDRLGCASASCHGSSKGKGSLRLSLFGAVPREDFEALTRLAPGRRVNPIEPDKSLLLLKVAGAVKHEGGINIKSGSPEYKLLLQWIAGGARWSDADAPSLISIEVSPAVTRIAKNGAAELKVASVYADGSRRDITDRAKYVIADRTVAELSAPGTVKAQGFGESVVLVSFLRRSASARVVVPRDEPKTFPDVATSGRIDELVLAKLKELNLPPSPGCSDEVFLRRVFLDTIGILPTPDEAKEFLADKTPDRRAKLIDKLLERNEFADFQSLHWGDLLRIKSEYPSNLWPNGVQAYHRWVRHAIATNKPYDRFARELLVSSGSNFRAPEANYYRALRKRDPQGYAESTALVFMGARIECARCHAHPTENWTLEDNLGMAAYFAQVRLKMTREWKEEIVYIDPDANLPHPVTRRPVAPKPLDAAATPVAPGEDPRAKFAEWLTAPDNPWFAPGAVNRVWFWLFGRGIVHEPDDMRPTNPPTNPGLLAYLAKELVDHDYDMKHVYRIILNSATYQRSSTPNEFNAGDVAHFARYPARRLDAEQLLDAIDQVAETFEPFSSQIPEPYTVLPDGTRATQLADGSIGTPFLELFGRPPRDSAYEGDRSSSTSMRQALHLINSSHIAAKISQSPRLARLLKENSADAEIADELYLAALSRYPTDEEKKKIVAHLSRDPRARRQSVEDVLWAILNTKEFLFNH